MGEISSAVQDEELIEHMRDVLLPFIKEVQVSEEIQSHVPPGFGTPEQVIERISSTVQAAAEGLTQEQVCELQVFITRKKHIVTVTINKCSMSQYYQSD